MIPGCIAVVDMVALVFVMYGAFVRLGPVPMLALAPVAAIVLGLGTVVVVAALKKAVMGTFKPEIKPLWSMYVWLNEMVNGAYKSVVGWATADHRLRFVLRKQLVREVIAHFGSRRRCPVGGTGQRVGVASSHCGFWGPPA